MATWNKSGLSRLVKIGHSMTLIYSYTLKLSAFLLRGRGGARFRGRWITEVPALQRRFLVLIFYIFFLNFESYHTCISNWNTDQSKYIKITINIMIQKNVKATKGLFPHQKNKKSYFILWFCLHFYMFTNNNGGSNLKNIILLLPPWKSQIICK